MSLSITSTITLASGVKLPILGFGVYQVLHPRESTLAALHAGYRHIDSARVYRSEAAVGEAVASFRQSQKDANTDVVFLTSKIQGKQHAAAKAHAAIDESVATLTKVGLAWDLYLLHDATSGPIRRLEAWRVLEEKVSEGTLHAIGVSNFSHVHLAQFAAAGVTKPEVNQIELHPFNQQRPIVDYCQAHGIVVQAYCPLVRGTRFDDPTIEAIAQETERSPAQILIRWSLQRGFVPLPKSDTPSRIIENANVFDFALSDSQMARLNALDEGKKGSCSWDPVEHVQIDFPKLPRRLLETPPDLFNCLLTFLRNRFSSLEVFINPLRVLSAHSHGLFKKFRLSFLEFFINPLRVLSAHSHGLFKKFRLSLLEFSTNQLRILSAQSHGLFKANSESKWWILSAQSPGFYDVNG